jgi:predicted secreted protein
MIRAALGFAALLSLASLIATAQEATPVTEPETLVTEADNGATVTLKPGAVLVVRLKENPSVGYSRALVSFPNMPVRLLSHKLLPNAAATAGGAPLAGAPSVGEWKFVAEGESTMGRAVWLKLLNLRPYAKGVDTTGLWEIKVVVPQTPSK